MTVIVFLVSASLSFVVTCYALLTLFWIRIEERSKLLDALLLKKELALYQEGVEESGPLDKAIERNDKNVERLLAQKGIAVRILKPMSYALLSITLLFSFAYIMDLSIL